MGAQDTLMAVGIGVGIVGAAMWWSRRSRAQRANLMASILCKAYAVADGAVSAKTAGNTKNKNTESDPEWWQGAFGDGAQAQERCLAFATRVTDAALGIFGDIGSTLARSPIGISGDPQRAAARRTALEEACATKDPELWESAMAVDQETRVGPSTGTPSLAELEARCGARGLAFGGG